MSSKKIMRLKTPVKGREEGKLSESTQLSGVQFNQQSTIMLVRNVTCSQQLQVTLINEINKLYREMGKFKRLAEDDSQKREQLTKEAKLLKSKLEVLERESTMYREMYELERDNHERLRKFYEVREKQWQSILTEHRKILQDHDHTLTISNIEPKHDYSSLSSMYTHLEQMLSHSFLQPQPQHQPIERRERRKLRSSLQREDSLSQPKLKLKLNSHKETSFKEGSHIQEKRERTPLKLKHSYQSPRHSHNREQGVGVFVQRNAQADEIFESIVRKTYYRYKEKSISVGEIEQMEDMVKLKNAKTSTKERLAKTIRKLDFQVGNENELKVLCESVEKAIMDKYKMLRGDFAFEYLVDKLKECEKLALSSNSELDRNKSQVGTQYSEIVPKCIYNDLSVIAKQQSDICGNKSLSIELLVNSTIKDDKMAERLSKEIDEDLSERIKFNGNIRKSTSEMEGGQGKSYLRRVNEDNEKAPFN